MTQSNRHFFLWHPLNYNADAEYAPLPQDAQSAAQLRALLTELSVDGQNPLCCDHGKEDAYDRLIVSCNRHPLLRYLKVSSLRQKRYVENLYGCYQHHLVSWADDASVQPSDPHNLRPLLACVFDKPLVPKDKFSEESVAAESSVSNIIGGGENDAVRNKEYVAAKQVALARENEMMSLACAPGYSAPTRGQRGRARGRRIVAGDRSGVTGERDAVGPALSAVADSVCTGKTLARNALQASLPEPSTPAILRAIFGFSGASSSPVEVVDGCCVSANHIIVVSQPIADANGVPMWIVRSCRRAGCFWSKRSKID